MISTTNDYTSMTSGGMVCDLSLIHILYPVWKCLLFIVLGGVCVVIGSQFVVNGATTIARACGMSERLSLIHISTIKAERFPLRMQVWR